MADPVKQTLHGWGRYPVETCSVFTPESDSQLYDILRAGLERSYVARGLGRSYGDTALNRDAGVISQLKLNRILSFDESMGLLECEAGVSLAQLIELFVPQGFFPPVVPGTKFVTVGGAIANDIHGKNHHCEGSFGNFIEEIRLLKPNGEIIACSPTINESIFSATLGGIGLTGFILSARFRLRPVETAYVTVDYHQAQNLDEALRLFSADDDQRYRYSVAWIDCLSKGRSMGRAVLMRGDHSRAHELPRHAARQPLLPPSSGLQWSVPFDLPSLMLNRFTIQAFNELFFRSHKTVAAKIVSSERFFFPLDSIRHWNRMYGRRGFVQYQAVFPVNESRAGLYALLEQLSSAGQASFLAVLKRFGEAGRGLLSFPMSGFTLALDIPFSSGLPKLLARLDEIVLRHSGRVYLAKDATLAPEAFAQMYPGLESFRASKRSVDPQGILSSSMARRLLISD